MSFSLESIRSKAVKESTFQTGKRMAEEGRAELSDIVSLSNGETEINGIIDKDIDVKIVINGAGAIRSYMCSNGNAEHACRASEMCVHATAAAFAYYRHLYMNTAMRTSTSEFMKEVMDSCVKRHVYDEMKEESKDIVLLPKIALDEQVMSFKIKSGSAEYIISDLGEFYNRMKNESEFEYGKALVLKHTMLSFEKGSRILLKILLSAINEEITFLKDCGIKSRNLFKQRDLKLKRNYMNSIADYIVGKTIEVELPGKVKKHVLFKRENPKINLTIKETLMGGYRLEPEKPVNCFALGNRLCIITSSSALFESDAYAAEGYIADEEYSEAMEGLLIKMNAETYREEDFSISRRDMTLFCGQVLPMIKKYVGINTGKLQIEEAMPQKLEAEFKLDINKKGEVICGETLSYGDFKLNPAKGGSVPVGIFRDYTKEYKIRMAIEKYVSTDIDEDGNFVVRDEDAIFRLLEEGIPQLMELGNVYVSDDFKGMKIRNAPKISVGAGLNENMLELEIDMEDFDREELLRMLDSYRLRKRYYRLKNGDFVKIEDNSLAVISEISEALELKDNDGKIIIPKYRALYIDTVLNQSGDIRLYRSKDFRQLVRDMREMADSDYEVPDTLVGVLRKYQRTGYRWLRTLAENGFGGILADDMGLGKTLQVITLLLAGAKEKDASACKNKPSLIVCPASLVYNWENEIKKFAPQLTALVISGTANERLKLLRTSENYEVIITSYDSLRRDMEYYNKLKFAYQVIDEAQFIKNPSTQNSKSVKEISAETKFALTGTPIENRLSELWSIFDYLMPGFLYNYSRFRDEIENRIIRDNDGVSLKRLQNMIKPFILRRLKNEVLKDLPEKQETVVYSKMEGRQRKLYDAMLLQFREDILEIPEEAFGAERMNVLAKLMRLRQICCDPALCFENYDDESAKLETCLELVRGAIDSGHKILLFSQFTTMLDRIAARFANEDISYYMLTGSVDKEERTKLAESFNTDDTQVFLISLKAGGTGLNLTGADIVIHYDPWWNVAVQNQATDRAYRMGQLKKVNVYKLIVKNSIEEKILKLQEGKERMVNQVVSEDVSNYGALTRNELLMLLESD